MTDQIEKHPMSSPCSIKVVPDLKNKIKLQAFKEGIPMYELVDKMFKQYKRVNR